MKQKRIVLFCVVWAATVIAAVFGVQFALDPQRKVDHQIATMRRLFEELEATSDPDERMRIRQEWNQRRDELVQLAYLKRVEYLAPIAGEAGVQEAIFDALGRKQKENWLSDVHLTPGPANTVKIVVFDESDRIVGWDQLIKDMLLRFEVAPI